MLELRWYKSVDDVDFKLQYRIGGIEWTDDDEGWMDVPFVLEDE